MEVLFPFQIYLFSQVQGDLENRRTETLILTRYLELIYRSARDLIEKAICCFCQQRATVKEIVSCLHHSILQQLVPFVMTCLYCGSLDDSIMIAADNQISELVRLWTGFLNVANLDVDSTGTEDAIQNGLFSKMYGSVASAATPWYFSLLYILVAADSRYITGLAPALVPLDPKDELMIVWERSYILSGGLARFALVGAGSWVVM